MIVWNPGQALLNGRYILERKLGEGGIGITYLAKNEQGKLRVIKTLKEGILNNPVWQPHQNKLKQDFRDEAMRLVVCRHPHIVKIENVFDEGGLPCIVMEYIEGEDLGDRLRRTRVLSEAEALLYIRQIGDALTVIHRQGLLHRDIKPRNIMIRADKSEAVLIDFGIAREFIRNVVQKHTVYRTPGFAPPEQYEFVAPRGEYIDVYALAATLYNLLTGVIPTSAENRRQNVPLQPLEYFNANICPSVKQAIMQGMELEPSHRPQSVQQWLDLLAVKDRVTVPTKVLSLPQLETGHKWQCVHTLKGHSSMVQAIAISPDGVTLASGSNDNTVKLWQLRTGKLLRTFGRWFSGHDNMVHSVAFSPDGEQIVSGSWDNTIKLWQVSTGKAIRTFTGHSNWVNSVAFSPNPPSPPLIRGVGGVAGMLASGSADCTVKLWEVDTVREIRTLTGHSDSVWSVAFSFDGGILASGSADYTIKIWQLSTGKNICTLTNHSFFVNSVTISRDGQILASGSSDKKIKLWNLNTGREIRTLIGHSDSVWSVAFSPDGQLLASGSWDKTIKIWHVSTGREICTISEHSNYVRAIAWSPDGQTLVSSSDDDTIKIWRQQ